MIMKVSDYIVDFFLKKGVNDFFGYQGTMISYFVDAIGRNDRARNHSCYNEQGAAFAACGAAQASNEMAVAYATSGPGAMNLLSGIANAYYDSLPVFFITGQVNTYEYLPDARVRQHSFQEADIVSMAKPVTKYAVKLREANQIRYELEKAYWIAMDGRKGAVLIDIPMDLQRVEIDSDFLVSFDSLEFADDAWCNRHDAIASQSFKSQSEIIASRLSSAFLTHRRPVFILGNGVDLEAGDSILDFAKAHSIPVITTLLAKGLVDESESVCFGYLGGAYGIRVANLIAAKKADLLICVGTSMVTRQTGTKTDQFASDATLIRIDIDPVSFVRKLGSVSYDFCVDSGLFASMLERIDAPVFDAWLAVCRECSIDLTNHDVATPERFPNRFIERVWEIAPENASIAVDVGQHMMWVAQSYKARRGQKFMFSGGHGAMGYALPAAIGATYVQDGPVIAFSGDGAFQMNIQELQWIARECLPVKVFVLNNHALGMVRVQQKVYFNHNFEGTSAGFNYDTPDFVAIAKAYGIRSVGITLESDLSSMSQMLRDRDPLVVVVDMPEDSFAYPKTLLGNPVYNQEPEIPSALLKKLLDL